jgi:hypothetical protein
MSNRSSYVFAQVPPWPPPSRKPIAERPKNPPDRARHGANLWMPFGAGPVRHATRGNRFRGRILSCFYTSEAIMYMKTKHRGWKTNCPMPATGARDGAERSSAALPGWPIGELRNCALRQSRKQHPQQNFHLFLYERSHYVYEKKHNVRKTNWSITMIAAPDWRREKLLGFAGLANSGSAALRPAPARKNAPVAEFSAVPLRAKPLCI